MDKTIFVFIIASCLILLIIHPVLGINLKIEKTSQNEVLITKINRPAVFELKVTNLGPTDNFKFYNLLSFSMTPIGTVQIGAGETKDIQLAIYPREDFDYRGFYTLQYHIQGGDLSQIIEKITIKIIDLQDAFEVGSGEVNPDSSSINIYIHNKENFDFREMSARFSSPLFDFEKNFSLGPNERKDFTIELNKKDFKKLMAGFYTMNVEVDVGGQKANIEGIVEFAEKNLVTTTKKEYGLFVHTKIITKTNEGNVLTGSDVVVKKNIISRLFTSFSPEPDNVDRQGLVVYYTWNKKIKPGESLSIRIKTNWLFPLLIIFFIILIVVFAKKYSQTDLVLRKKVSFVKAKGGEFALKVSIIVSAKKYIERISVIDRIPIMAKIYERFGPEKPFRVDEKNKRIEWSFEKLEAGENRILSYVIYSKLGIIGKFALPSATAVYEKDGTVHESESNRAFFVTEQRKEDVGE